MSRNKKNANNDECEAGSPLWMTTFADMMTLLLCFFVLILAFSSIEQDKFKKAMGSLRGALGMLKSISGMTMKSSIRKSASESQMKEALEEMDKVFEQMNLKEVTKWELTPEGIHIVVNDPVLFELGKANLKSEVYPVLSAIAKVIKSKTPSEIEVQGHTDDLPIKTMQFPSNWELSAARALSVVKFFAEKEDVPPEKLSAIGYGQYRPAYVNTRENRTKNRRVEIFIKHGQFPMP
jgi:chemotaxis protein MotB